MALDLSLAGTSATQLEDFREEKIEVVVEDDVAYFSSPKSQNVIAIAFHPEKNFIAIGTSEGKVLLWDLNQFKEVNEFKLSDTEVKCMKWNSKGTELAVGTSSDLCVLHFANEKFESVPTTVIEKKYISMFCEIEWNPSGTHLAICDDCHIYIYSEETKKTRSKFNYRSKIAWQNNELFTFTSSKTFHFFNTDLTEMRNVFKVKVGVITALDWDRSGDFLAYVTLKGWNHCDVKVWQSSSRKICRGWENNQRNGDIKEIKWLKSANALDGENGIVLASISYIELKLWKKDGTCSVIHKIGKPIRFFSPSGLFFENGHEIRTTLTNVLVKNIKESRSFSLNLKEDLFAFQKVSATENKIGIIKLQIKTSHCDEGGAPLIVPSGSQDDANGPPSQPQLRKSQQQSKDNLEDDELEEKSMRIPLMDGPAQREAPGEQNLQLY